MVGMMPPAPPGAKPDSGPFGQVITQAREESVDEILPGEEPRAFYNLSVPKKIIVMATGTILNLALAAAFTALSFALGITSPTTTVATLSECVPPVSGEPCGPTDAPAPALAAGLLPGDEILTYDGLPVTNWSELLTDIQDAGTGRAVPIEVRRGGQVVELTVEPVSVEREAVGADGEPEIVSSAFLGIGPTMERQRIPMSEIPGALWEMFSGTVRLVVTFPLQIFRVAQGLITGADRGADSVMSVVGVGRAAVDVAGAEALSVMDRVTVMVSLLASLNMAMFVFNLIPLLPLDGGHVVPAIWEGIRRTIARVRGVTPLPGPVDVARLLPIAYVMIVFLIGSTLLLVLADVVDPVRIFQ